MVRPAVRALLREAEKILRRLHVVLRDDELRLGVAELDIVARHLGDGLDENATSLLLGRFELGVSSLNLASHLAPEIDRPHGVEAGTGRSRAG